MINELKQYKEFEEIIYKWTSLEEEFQYKIGNQSLEINHKSILTSNYLSSAQKIVT